MKCLHNFTRSMFLCSWGSNLYVCVQSTDSGCHYNIQLVNALVLYVGTQAIQHVNSKGQSPSMNTIAPSTHMDIFQNLTVNLDTEGSYSCFCGWFLASAARQKLLFSHSVCVHVYVCVYCCSCSVCVFMCVCAHVCILHIKKSRMRWT